MAYAGRARTTRSKYCFSLSHSEQHCELLPALSQTNDTESKTRLTVPATQPFQAQQFLICNEWNYNPAPCCPIPRCRYRHICLPCSQNPRIIDKSHKPMFFPNFPGQAPTHTTIPSLVQPSSQPFQAQQGSGFLQGYNNHPSGFQHFQSY